MSIQYIENISQQLEDEIQECKRASFQINEHLNKIELHESSKEETMHMMRRNVSEMKNVGTTKSWADICGGDLVSK